jgi:hypothetical protein
VGKCALASYFYEWGKIVLRSKKELVMFVKIIGCPEIIHSFMYFHPKMNCYNYGVGQKSVELLTTIYAWSPKGILCKNFIDASVNFYLFHL